MGFHYSPGDAGFFADDIHDDIPDDAVALTDEEYQNLRAGLDGGQVISVVNGYPVLADKPVPTDVERRTKWRQTAFLTRMNFVIACKRSGILSTEEAIAAAKGDWPTSFADALADPGVDIDPDEAQIIWAAASQVERLHPLIAAVQTHRNMTDDEVDALFGYEPAS